MELVFGEWCEGEWDEGEWGEAEWLWGCEAASANVGLPFFGSISYCPSTISSSDESSTDFQRCKMLGRMT